MNLMILDDEYYSVEGLRRQLNWSELGFDNVFCAYCADQAKDIFVKETVDVLLSDVEMPKASGLDLLAWIRSYNYETECVFLTCYAKFEYATKALQLESVGYLLKPASDQELIAAIEKASKKVKRKQTEKLNKTYAIFWSESLSQRIDSFWKRLAQGAIVPNRINFELQESGLPDSWETDLLPVLADCKPEIVNDSCYDDLTRKALTSSFPDSFAIARISDTSFLILSNPSSSSINSQCESAISALSKSYQGVFRFFPGNPCAITDFHKAYLQLNAESKNDVSQKSFVRNSRSEKKTAIPIPKAAWSDLLLQNRYEELNSKVNSHLNSLEDSDSLDRSSLSVFMNDFAQIVYSLMDRLSISASKAFSSEFAELSTHACDGIPFMAKYVDRLISAYSECVKSLDEENSIIDTVCAYIKANLSSDLSRNALASKVFISPDYMSHIFKEKTGMSLSKFIINERIQCAKELLLQNKLGIMEIGMECGFANSSYFSKQFRAATGQTPQEFKKSASSRNHG
ncbi:MAG: response regulator [Clostridiales bacterium]|jgi:two-component system response regulator YesN|nr:response regulator [Clostridiales bacterium]